MSCRPARRLDELHGKLESRYKIYKLRDALDALATSYDQIYIDTPPALNFYTRSALIAAQGCLIPFDCDDFSRRALYTLLESVQEIQADHNKALKVEGIVVNQFQPRANLPQRMVQELIDEGLPVLQPYLRSSVPGEIVASSLAERVCVAIESIAVNRLRRSRGRAPGAAPAVAQTGQPARPSAHVLW
jgi:cellulose biosynthesis protein BcsQ